MGQEVREAFSRHVDELCSKCKSLFCREINFTFYTMLFCLFIALCLIMLFPRAPLLKILPSYQMLLRVVRTCINDDNINNFKLSIMQYIMTAFLTCQCISLDDHTANKFQFVILLFLYCCFINIHRWAGKPVSLVYFGRV